MIVVKHEFSDKGCIVIKNKEGKNFTLCVGTKKDMGSRVATLISKDKPKSFEDVGKLTKQLYRQGLSTLELKRATQFVSKNFRDSISKKQEFASGASIGPFELKGKKSEENRT